MARDKLGRFLKGENGMLGKKFSQRSIENIRKAQKSRSRSSQEGFQKGHPVFGGFKSRFRKGCKAWNKGEGNTSLGRRIRLCFRYRQWHSDILTRDDYTCQICNKRGGKLEVDHYPKMFSEIFHGYKIKSWEEAMDCEELWNINNGRTLCKECHNKTKYANQHTAKT